MIAAALIGVFVIGLATGYAIAAWHPEADVRPSIRLSDEYKHYFAAEIAKQDIPDTTP